MLFILQFERKLFLIVQQFLSLIQKLLVPDPVQFPVRLQYLFGCCSSSLFPQAVNEIGWNFDNFAFEIILGLLLFFHAEKPLASRIKHNLAEYILSFGPAVS